MGTSIDLFDVVEPLEIVGSVSDPAILESLQNLLKINQDIFYILFILASILGFCFISYILYSVLKSFL